MNIHHIGIACKDIDASRKTIFSIGDSGLVRLEYDPAQKAMLGLYRWCGQLVEFVSGDVVKGILKCANAVQYHICFETHNIYEQCHEMEKNGWRLISPPKPAILFDGRRVAFLIHRDFGMIELLEDKND